MGKYTPNYNNIFKFVPAYKFKPELDKRVESHRPSVAARSTKNNLCGRLFRSIQKRQSRLDAINKIFRKQRNGRSYYFGENSLKKKIDSLNPQHKNKQQIKISRSPAGTDEYGTIPESHRRSSVINMTSIDPKGL